MRLTVRQSMRFPALLGRSIWLEGRGPMLLTPNVGLRLSMSLGRTAFLLRLSSASAYTRRPFYSRMPASWHGRAARPRSVRSSRCSRRLIPQRGSASSGRMLLLPYGFPARSLQGHSLGLPAAGRRLLRLHGSPLLGVLALQRRAIRSSAAGLRVAIPSAWRLFFVRAGQARCASFRAGLRLPILPLMSALPALKRPGRRSQALLPCAAMRSSMLYPMPLPLFSPASAREALGTARIMRFARASAASS